MRRFESEFLFTFSTKFRLPTAIASDHYPSLAILSRVIESSTFQHADNQGLALGDPQPGYTQKFTTTGRRFAVSKPTANV
jgi:hypothetical protein